MSTTKTSTNTTQFDPSSLSQYQSFWSMASPLLNSLIQNPYNNSNYALNLAQGQQVAGQAGQQAIGNSLANLNTSGMGQANSGVKAALLAQGARYGSALNYGAFQSAANQAQTNQWNAIGVQANRSPLVTGSTNVQKTSGLGSWLPQVASMAVGGLTSVFGQSGGSGGGGSAASTMAGNSAAGLSPTGTPQSAVGSLFSGGGNSYWSPTSTISPINANPTDSPINATMPNFNPLVSMPGYGQNG